MNILSKLELYYQQQSAVTFTVLKMYALWYFDDIPYRKENYNSYSLVIIGDGIHSLVNWV